MGCCGSCDGQNDEKPTEKETEGTKTEGTDSE